MANAAYAELGHRFGQIKDLQHGLSILGWDHEVMMPSGGEGLRAQSLATLDGVVHQRLSDDGFAKLVQRLSRKSAGLTPRQRRAVELVRRQVDAARAVPAELAHELSLAKSRGVTSWRAAREARDFSIFRSDLERLVDLKRREARHLSKRGSLYDALLDQFEPGATMAELDDVVSLTAPLLKTVLASDAIVDTSPFAGPFAIDDQRAFASDVVSAMGIVADRSRLDLSTHPFCGGVGPTDVRMTTRYDERDLRVGLFGLIHEGGHGLYEQGLDPKRARSPLGGAISMALHESQSRLWENLIARGQPFWTYWLPRLKRRFPGHPRLKGVTVKKITRAANEIRPSMIRVEADDLTYNLHIVLRTRLERSLIEGHIEVADLPTHWNDAMTELLGVTPKHDADGVLQDIHWATGLFGYFPTYTIGNLYASQFLEAARKAIRGLDGKLARGEFSVLREWLREQIHSKDQTETAARLVKRVTGRPLDAKALGRDLRRKVTSVYGK